LQLSEEDTSLFDKRFTKMTPVDSPVDHSHMLSESVNNLFQVRSGQKRQNSRMENRFSRRRFAFQGFTYVAPSILAAVDTDFWTLSDMAHSKRRLAAAATSPSSRMTMDEL
jgi:Protein kinase C terminal domain